MGRPRLLVDDTTLQRLVRGGFSQEQIAEISTAMTGEPVTRGAVAAHMHRMGWAAEQPSHRDWIPWRVRQEHQKAYAMRMLRTASRQRQGLPLTQTDVQRAHSFFGALAAAQMAVAYGPDLAEPFWAVPADVDAEGWTVRRLLVRVPQDGVPAFTRTVRAHARAT